jgi:hypothetical protein
LRIEFLTTMASKVHKVSTNVGGFVHQQCFDNLQVSPVDCVVPLKVFGALRALKKNNRIVAFEV